ncbi:MULTISPECIES: hypothetical protein [Pseudomonadaceae]|jgi:hypothetical protein|uniref:Uncharacterized protein n=3 Tax=Pseudomonadaceae TaxID=135621 RepID=A0A2G5FNN5_9PSED|nr:MULTISPECIES: hypothetical protein [Pseudomonas]KFJ92708.1 hypothetical protein JF55_04405 [Pseudomonas sp. 1-7]MBP8884802.1 hypothetical protein [Pseudomonas sp.]AXO61548.1 hypothetical protein DZC76_09925 [Pseudomonas sp. phDV1]MBN7117632.1 hypothetical protein [Pseudomonas oleovorans]MBN7134413.1 hypothetical protein [Pseudomonas oleovorans]
MIKNHRTRLLVLASLSLLTTLLALSGIGKGSAGAVARNIECSHKLAHHLDLAESLKRQRSSPPPNRSERLSPYFVLTQQT